MKRKRIMAVGVCLVVAATAYLWKAHRAKDSVKWIEVTPATDSIEVSIRTTGTVQSQNRLEVKPPTPGRIEEVLAQEGDKVRKGAVLAWMSSSERVSLLDAARAKGEAEVKRWKEIYRATPVLAPMSGTLILSGVKPGQTVINSDIVFVISDRLVVQAIVDETDIAKVQPKQQARIALDAYPDRPVEGTVSRIAFDAKTVNNVTTYQVEVIPNFVPDFMRSGMTANVLFTVEKHDGVVLLPSDAVTQDGKDSFVWVRDAQGERVSRPVKVGLSDGKRLEILEGISIQDVVLSKEWRLPAEAAKTVNPFMPQMGRRPDRRGGGNGKK